MRKIIWLILLVVILIGGFGAYYHKGLLKTIRVNKTYVENTKLWISGNDGSNKELISSRDPDGMVFDRNPSFKNFYTLEYETCDYTQVGKECSVMRYNLVTGHTKTISQGIPDPESRIAWAKVVYVEQNSLFIASSDRSKKEQLTYRSSTDRTTENNPKFYDPYHIVYLTCSYTNKGKECSLLKRNLISDHEVVLLSGLQDSSGAGVSNSHYAFTNDKQMVITISNGGFVPGEPWFAIYDLKDKKPVAEFTPGMFDPLVGYETPNDFISPDQGYFFVVGLDTTNPPYPNEYKPTIHVYDLMGKRIYEFQGSKPAWSGAGKISYTNWTNQRVQGVIPDDYMRKTDTIE